MRSITTSAYQTRESSRFLSYPGYDHFGRIRISILGFNPEFLYLVYKKICFLVELTDFQKGEKNNLDRVALDRVDSMSFTLNF